MEPEKKKGLKPWLDRIQKYNFKLPFDVKKLTWKSPVIIGGALTAFLVLGGGGYYYGSTAPAAYVLVNGEEVGIVKNEEEGQKLIDEILTEVGAPYGESAKTHDEITFNPVRVENNYEPINKNELKSKLSYYIEGVEVKVGDSSLFVLPEKEDVDRLLEAYQSHFIEESETNKVTAVSYEEEITLTDVEVLPEEIMDFDKALAMLKEGYVQREEYVVEKNDSWWLIARKNNLLTDEVLAANPGNTIDTIIKPGDVLNIEKVTPYLTVVFEGTRTDVEIIPFDVITKTDYSLASGKTKVTKAGADGEKEVTYNYVQKNNKIVEKTVTDEKILKKPVDQVVAKGPARRASYTVASASRGSGVVPALTRPFGGSVSSYYGYRGREFHTGIDYAGPSGSPFVAAAAGKVISAGWQGNYGYSLLIDHGNGVQTRYAHASKLLVSAGQNVSKGQTIGLIGSTGRSSGPHLHFEVIVNGSHVNPRNYVK